jgi:hypothetical protein
MGFNGFSLALHVSNTSWRGMAFQRPEEAKGWDIVRAGPA